METVNSIYLRRRNKVLIADESKFHSSDNFYMILTMLKNIETLGYVFSESLLNRLSELDCDQLADFYHDLIPDLKKMVGAHRKFEPMYPNFPKQVMKASDAELYTNAMMHYLGDWIGLRIMPQYKKKERKPLKGDVTYKVIDLGSQEDFESIFTNLVSSNTSISQTDKEDVEWFVKTLEDRISDLIPSELPNKENMAFLSARLLEYVGEAKATTLVRSYVKTATDVLRIVVGLSGGDVSLAQPCKFRNFKKRERRFILGLLDSVAQDNSVSVNEDMQRWTERWKRLANKLHPNEFEDRYAKASVFITCICNNFLLVETFNSRLEEAYKRNDYAKVVKILSERAGEFARNLDRVLRMVSKDLQESDAIVGEFRKVAGQVSTPVLLQVMAHFKHRNGNKDLRIFLPKGNIAKVYGKEETLPNLNMFVCGVVVQACEDALRERFSKLPSLGNVYLDERLKGYPVPFSQRSASKALKTVSRGSRIKLEDGKNTVRFFIWWKNAPKGKRIDSHNNGYYNTYYNEYDGRVDIDLSATVLDEDYNTLSTISFYNLRDGVGCHSGDITSAPRGACEFIDMDIKKYREQYPKARYIAMHINSFTQHKYIDLPECFAGFMMRTKPKSGEIFDARTVEQKFDVTADGTYVMPLLIDMETREVIWTDMVLKQTGWRNTVASHLQQSTLMVRSMVEMVKPNLYDLFRLHAEARGVESTDIDTFNTIFTASTGMDAVNPEIKYITPYDIDVIASEYLV